MTLAAACLPGGLRTRQFQVDTSIRFVIFEDVDGFKLQEFGDHSWKRKNRGGCSGSSWAVLLLFWRSTTTVALLLYVLHDEGDSDFSFSSNKIGVIELSGVIFDSKSWIEQLQRFGEQLVDQGHYSAHR